MGDLHRFRIGQMQGLLNPFRFIILQIKNDLSLAVVDDTFAKATFIQIEEIVEVLAREDRRASIPTYRFRNLQKEIAGQPCACGAGAGKELPAFIDEDGFFFCAVGLCPVPHEIKCHKHPYSQQIAGERGNVQHGIFVIQTYIGLLVKCTGLTVNQTVENMSHAGSFRRSFQNLMQVAQHRHFPVLTRIGWVIQ